MVHANSNEVYIYEQLLNSLESVGTIHCNIFCKIKEAFKEFSLKRTVWNLSKYVLVQVPGSFILPSTVSHF